MDFDYTEEEQEFRRELRDWLEENLPEGWQEGDTQVPEDTDEREQFLRDWQRTLYEGGWAGVHWPEEYGGRGASLIEQVIYNQEMARVDAPPTINIIAIAFVGPTLVEVGTDEQKERFIPNMLNGEEIWCQGYSEPGAGSDLASLQCEAVDEGDQFRINGQKIWTSYAHYADWCFLLTRTDESGDKHHGITALLVDMDQEGVSTEPIHQISDDRTYNHMYFDDAVAKKEHVVGEVDKGWDVAMTLSAFEHATSDTFGLEERWKDVVEYCQNTVRDGQPLSEDPVVRQRLAEFDARIQAGKLTYLRNVSKQMKTGVPGPEGSMDKVFNNQTHKELENFAMTLLGPEAGLWEDGQGDGSWVEDFFGPYGATIAGGTAEIQRNIIAERVLGLPKDVKE